MRQAMGVERAGVSRRGIAEVEPLGPPKRRDVLDTRLCAFKPI